ncbi:MAG: hypothetical protein GHCLOJNM_04658 [bacterium]|nr:hypothetical protein [bacterium]
MVDQTAHDQVAGLRARRGRAPGLCGPFGGPRLGGHRNGFRRPWIAPRRERASQPLALEVSGLIATDLQSREAGREPGFLLEEFRAANRDRTLTVLTRDRHHALDDDGVLRARGQAIAVVRERFGAVREMELVADLDEALLDGVGHAQLARGLFRRLRCGTRWGPPFLATPVVFLLASRLGGKTDGVLRAPRPFGRRERDEVVVVFGAGGRSSRRRDRLRRLAARFGALAVRGRTGGTGRRLGH